MNALARSSSRAACILVACGSAARANSPLPSYGIVPVGLYGSGYTGQNGLTKTFIDQSTSEGRLAGRSERRTPSTVLGYNTWVFDPVLRTTFLAGLTSPAHTGSAGYQLSSIVEQRSTGRVAGYSTRFTGVNTTNGQDAWLYNPQTHTTSLVGPTDNRYTRSNGFRNTVFVGIYDSGAVYGRTQRTGDGVAGWNAWYQSSPDAPAEIIGLTDAAYTSSVGGQTTDGVRALSSGNAVGASIRYFWNNTEGYLGPNTWYFDRNSHTTTIIGLYGAAQTSSQGSQGSAVARFAAIDGVHDIISGLSQRYSGSTENGFNTWVFDSRSASTIQTGLFTPAHTGSDGYQLSQEEFLTEKGYSIGFSNRVVDATTSNGKDTWVWSPRTSSTIQTGLYGPEFTGTSGYRVSGNALVTMSGLIIGNSVRISGERTTNGNAVWMFDPATETTYPVGLTGPGFTGTGGFANSNLFGQTNGDGIAGTSSLISGVSQAVGQATWVFDRAQHATVRIGLVDADHTLSNNSQFSEFTNQSFSGFYAGFSQRRAGGNDSWVFNPATFSITQTGLAGPSYTSAAGVYRSRNSLLSETGWAAGTTGRLGVAPNAGADAWVFDPATQTSYLAGLTTGAHTDSSGYRSNTPQTINDAGWTSGIAERRLNFSANGQSTWVFNPVTHDTIETGLTDAVHTGSAGYRYSQQVQLLSNGIQVGFTRRIAGVSSLIGQDLWYFDPSTSLTHQITAGVPGAVRTSDGYGFSESTIITDNGFVLGYYSFFSAPTGSGIDHAFIFRPDLGFRDLGSLVDGSLSLQGWDFLMRPEYSDAVAWIAGTGRFTGQTASGSQAAFYLYPIPSPCSALSLLAGACVVARRRR